MTTYFNQKKLFSLFLLMAIFLLPQDVFATSSSSLPWDSAFDKLKASITGPVALGIALIGIAVAGGILIFGGELGQFASRICMLVLVLALLVAANNVLSSFYTTSASVITDNTVNVITENKITVLNHE